MGRVSVSMDKFSEAAIIRYLTQYEAGHAKEGMQRIQPPLDVFLKIGRDLPNEVIESPIRGGGNRYSLGSHGKRQNLV